MPCNARRAATPTGIEPALKASEASVLSVRLRVREQWSDNYYKIIISCCNTIAENPLLRGKKYNDVKDGLLGCKVKKHIIFYQICNEEVLIIRILHERMDYYKTSQW